MAKKRATRGRRSKSEVNRSQKIREYLEQNRKATNSDIKEALAAEGIEVSDNLISGVRRRAGISGSRRRRKGAGRKGTGRKAMGRGKHRGQAAASSSATGKTRDEVSVSALMAAGKFAAEVGGVDKARRLLDVLAQLASRQVTLL